VTPITRRRKIDSLRRRGAILFTIWIAFCIFGFGPLLLFLNIALAWDSASYIGVAITVTVIGSAAFAIFDYGRRQERAHLLRGSAPGQVLRKSKQRLPTTSREMELRRQHSQESMEAEPRQLEK